MPDAFRKAMLEAVQGASSENFAMQNLVGWLLLELHESSPELAEVVRRALDKSADTATEAHRLGMPHAAGALGIIQAIRTTTLGEDQQH